MPDGLLEVVVELDLFLQVDVLGLEAVFELFDLFEGLLQRGGAFGYALFEARECTSSARCRG